MISRGCSSSYRLRLVLEDLSGLLFVAQLLDALPLQVALLVLFKQRVGSLVPAQELGGCGLAQDYERHIDTQPSTHSNVPCKVGSSLSVFASTIRL